MPADWLVEGGGEIAEVKGRLQKSTQISAEVLQTGRDSMTRRKRGQEELWTFPFRKGFRREMAGNVAEKCA